MTIDVYIDGACRGNGKDESIGAYAYKLKFGDRAKEFSMAIPSTTNNKMELTAAIEALKALKDSARQYKINVYSDSQYVVKGVNEWSKAWKAKNFYQVKNAEMWQELLSIVDAFPSISFIWVKGHETTQGNIDVDILCNKAMDEYRG